MKKLILFLLAIYGSQLWGQNIPNPSFDSIYFGGIDRIFEWVTSDGVGIHGAGQDTIPPLQPNTFYDASNLQYSEILDQGVFIDTTSHSNWALRLKSQPGKYKVDGSPYESYVVNGNHFYTGSDGYIDFSKCGTPFTGTPIALTGYYRFEEASAQPNWGVCEVLLKRFNVNTLKHDTMAYAKETMTFNYTPTWQHFSIPINYIASAPPDSVVIVFKAAATPHLPTTFWVDELAFEYGHVSVEENTLSELKIYPNPTENELMFSEVCDYSILDLSGQLIEKGTNTNKISIQHLAEGAYLLILEKDNFLEQRKFIKK